jgi:Fic family protein
MITSSFEPLLPTDERGILEDLAADLLTKSNLLKGSIRPEILLSVSELVRSMNCYYSNLIEGHNTTPRQIDEALAEDYSADTKIRDRQYEAVSHIKVQKLIDEGEDIHDSPQTIAYTQWLHKKFCANLPEKMLFVEHPSTEEKLRLIPGRFRENEVRVGRHIPPEVSDISAYMKRFEEAYDPLRLSKMKSIVGVAAAHHRFVWVHPFLDGNGRVARLMSYAMLQRLQAGNSTWSIARGLARNSDEYKTRLSAADSRRLDDYDGRGALSNKRLFEFCEYFLITCIDQVEFMSSILNLNELARRIQLYCDDEISAKRLPKGSNLLLREALLTGQIERSNAGKITGYQERQARTVLTKLIELRLLVSDGPRTPVRLGFPHHVTERWFPTLYSAK